MPKVTKTAKLSSRVLRPPWASEAIHNFLCLSLEEFRLTGDDKEARTLFYETTKDSLFEEFELKDFPGDAFPDGRKEQLTNSCSFLKKFGCLTRYQLAEYSVLEIKSLDEKLEGALKAKVTAEDDIMRQLVIPWFNRLRRGSPRIKKARDERKTAYLDYMKKRNPKYPMSEWELQMWPEAIEQFGRECKGITC